jgi:ABC-2 type transport system ATP-binding protein
MPSALCVRGLLKRFGAASAVDHLDLSVREGEFYALLGPNGAGKTTTLRIVAGLLTPDAGSVEVFGIDRLRNPIDAKQVMAWVPDEPTIYDKLTPSEYLAFVAALWRIDASVAQSRAEELMHRLELNSVANQRCESFSRGMKQKVALAGALIHQPRLLILDEPLTGLDAAMARTVKDILAERTAEGGTVILTTHILEVAERMADRIGIIRRGSLVAEGTMAELRSRFERSDGTLEDMFLDVVAGRHGLAAAA